MTSRRLTAALASALLLAAPAPVLAQSAGDDQYQDPFGSEDVPAGTEEQGELTDEAPGLGNTPPSDPGDGGGERETETSDTTAGGTQLPATGTEATLMAMLGAGLLLTGTGLRLRLRAGARA